METFLNTNGDINTKTAWRICVKRNGTQTNLLNIASNNMSRKKIDDAEKAVRVNISINRALLEWLKSKGMVSKTISKLVNEKMNES